jgi:hypothetical protein
MAIPQIPSNGKGEGASVSPVDGASDELVEGLVDEMLGYYIDWRQQARAVGDAYARWCGAQADEEALRFSAYLAALDREESTAMSYAGVVRAVEDMLRCAHSVSNAV